MTKEMMIDGKKYTISEVTAIALCAGDTEEQDALLVIIEDESFVEKYEAVVFGFGMPEDEDDMRSMFDEPEAWDSDWKTLETVREK